MNLQESENISLCVQVDAQIFSHATELFTEHDDQNILKRQTLGWKKYFLLVDKVRADVYILRPM